MRFSEWCEGRRKHCLAAQFALLQGCKLSLPCLQTLVLSCNLWQRTPHEASSCPLSASRDAVLHRWFGCMDPGTPEMSSRPT